MFDDDAWRLVAVRHYHRKNWQLYRKEVIELDGGVCTRCKRGPSEGAVLQVHHKQYIAGRLPWEYPYDLCETLCKGCHAEEHSIVAPSSGWECFGYDDLGDLSGECELCGNSIRYVFFVQHENWPPLEVGEICCDNLTESSVASDYVDSILAHKSRLQRFIKSPRWKTGDDGIFRIRQKRIDLAVEPVDNGYRLSANRIQGKRFFSSAVEVKKHVFELLESGKLEEYLKNTQGHALPKRKGRANS
ncbi:HNH endonuclease [Rhodomicrobium udaipurense]|uniref:HNH endonuclease n=1 Tax=Rhodomicrobium udaipurense TaxID=1202716 RepID=UPI0012DEDC6D|nr:hypothetical protein [Rhodomicrobium udaipurense]